MLEMVDGGLKGMQNIKNGVFGQIPRLHTVSLRLAFGGMKRAYLKDAGSFENVEEIGVTRGKGQGRRLPWVFSRDQLDSLSYGIQSIVVGYHSCNESELNVLDLSPYQWLKRLRVGMCCFENVEEVKMIGLNELESVVIGKSSFTKCKNDLPESYPNRHFYLKNCPKLKSLTVGCYSFCDYDVCEIENVDALEVIEIGGMKKDSHNFFYASLELKSILIHSE